jgi:hypothetical protein
LHCNQLWGILVLSGVHTQHPTNAPSTIIHVYLDFLVYSACVQEYIRHLIFEVLSDGSIVEPAYHQLHLLACWGQLFSLTAGARTQLPTNALSIIIGLDFHCVRAAVHSAPHL